MKAGLPLAVVLTWASKSEAGRIARDPPTRAKSQRSQSPRVGGAAGSAGGACGAGWPTPMFPPAAANRVEASSPWPLGMRGRTGRFAQHCPNLRWGQKPFQADVRLDVENGTRPTVRNVESRGIVIDTDGGVVRELPARYVSEHAKLPYCSRATACKRHAARARRTARHARRSRIAAGAGLAETAAKNVRSGLATVSSSRALGEIARHWFEHTASTNRTSQLGTMPSDG
jgi:hypothetical protein